MRIDDPALRLPELRMLLAEHGVTEADIHAAEPGIEDVFVALLGQEETV